MSEKLKKLLDKQAVKHFTEFEIIEFQNSLLTSSFGGVNPGCINNGCPMDVPNDECRNTGCVGGENSSCRNTNCAIK